MSAESRDIALTWLSAFTTAFEEKNLNKITSLFLPSGWLRDSLVFSWDSRSLEGPLTIAEYLEVPLTSALIGNIKLDERSFLRPSFFPASPDVSGVELAFTFETPIAHGRGFVRLLPGAFGGESWKALSVYLAVEDIKDHEEVGHELGLYGGHTISWEEIKAERRARIEQDPEALIIGAGQTGLQVAARFSQMGIPSIVIEKNARVGDNWRKRYPTLTLHTPRTHHSLLYSYFPSTWPTYTPRDKVAGWLEQYADSQDLVVWTNSYALPRPTYDPSTKKWTVIVNKDGEEVIMHPAHIVLATGTLGDAFVPSILNSDVFQGKTLHASGFQGGQCFAGQRVLVVGAGNTSADICQDLVVRGAREVTMLQRSATCVVSAAFIKEEFNVTWPEGVPTDVSDFKIAAMPLGLLKKLSIAMQDQVKGFDRAMHEGLEKNGLKLTYGPEGAGQKLLVFERLGGYWIDVGVADLIINGKLKVKSGVEVANFTETGVEFTDGEGLEVDVIIFATGYHNIRPTMKGIFGDEIIDRTHEVWGLDEEGELRGCYRPSGHPGLWFAAGDFYNSRYQSKQLALLIKAEELGLTDYPNVASISQLK